MGRAARERDDDTSLERNRICCKRLLQALRREHPNGPPPDVAVQAARVGARRIAPPEAGSGCSSAFAW